MYVPDWRFFLLLSLFCLPSAIGRPDLASRHTILIRERYTTAHSLGEDYLFDARDGWEGVNVTNLAYKYRRHFSADDVINSNASPLAPRAKKPSTKESAKSSRPSAAAGGLVGFISQLFKGLKGLGKPEPVTITWYTGHDLQNPSCWKNGEWAPTDRSFVAALTLDGWNNKPKCFKFLELCHTPKKCVFVRVVDTCAGCAAGSKHVDLTRAAFGQLADFDKGVLQVQLRSATEPNDWLDDIWGPKVKDIKK
ncbi:RlpA-like double-psi beta-barrel-protein domain-containing protein-containing protein [Panaeolus papilionaceus]|nr:RlpA-like double-psi beta-barrel-protein domain-containing protein-containing protein [Panaeolus papilionaceus]